MPNTPRGLATALARRIDFNSCLTVVCCGAILITLAYNRQIGHNIELQVANNRDTVNSVGDRDEKLILDFMSRTVDRWDKFQRDNPQLKVPIVIEPVDKPHLTEEEMERSPTSVPPK